MKKLQVNIAADNEQNNEMPEIRILDHKFNELSRKKAWSIEEMLKPGIYKISAKIPGKSKIEKLIAIRDADQSIDLDVTQKPASTRHSKYKKPISNNAFKIIAAERAQGEKTEPGRFKFSAQPTNETAWRTPWARISYKTASYLISLPLESRTNSNCKVSFYSASNRRYPNCLLYTSPSPRDKRQSRMPSSA